MFFLECPGMSQPLDSATPGRPPKVPFSGKKGLSLCFWVKKMCLWTPSQCLHLTVHISYGVYKDPLCLQLWNSMALEMMLTRFLQYTLCIFCINAKDPLCIQLWNSIALETTYSHHISMVHSVHLSHQCQRPPLPPALKQHHIGDYAHQISIVLLWLRMEYVCRTLTERRVAALGLLANLKETREVKRACQVKATSNRNVVSEWCLWFQKGNYET